MSFFRSVSPVSRALSPLVFCALTLGAACGSTGAVTSQGAGTGGGGVITGAGGGGGHLATTSG